MMNRVLALVLGLAIVIALLYFTGVLKSPLSYGNAANSTAINATDNPDAPGTTNQTLAPPPPGAIDRGVPVPVRTISSDRQERAGSPQDFESYFQPSFYEERRRRTTAIGEFNQTLDLLDAEVNALEAAENVTIAGYRAGDVPNIEWPES